MSLCLNGKIFRVKGATAYGFYQDPNTVVQAAQAANVNTIDPGAKIVAGYLDLMPAYATQFTPRRIDALTSYLRSLPGAARAASAVETGSGPEMDPVCGMATRVGAETTHASYPGHDYHFCSASCLRRFRADPRKYLEKETQASR